MVGNVTKHVTGFAPKLVRFLSSRRFFYGVLVFFVLESLWIALSARYPMAFDEDFHMGIIKIYSQHWLPFLSGQPDGANTFGAVAHDPSYLYHYLMSFPYRLLAACTDSQAIQVIGLRLLNIPMVVLALLLFRRLLRRVGMSDAYTHTALALFALIPILPLLAGQINYDNLLLPLVALTCLLAVDVYSGFRRRECNLALVGALAVVCMAASLVKYAFLPLAAVTVGFLAVGLWQGFHGRGRALATAVYRSAKTLRRRTAVVLALGVLVLAGLFIQRYGVNMVQYHTPVPSCDAVLNESACRSYGPWLRNYELAKAKGETDSSPVTYTVHWVQALHYRLFFMVNGPHDNFRNYPPLLLPSATAVLLAVSASVALLLYGRRVFSGQPLLIYLAALVGFYAAVLWAEDYSQFIETGQPVAINGRYLLPVALPLAAVAGRALRVALSGTPRVKAWAAAVVLVLFLQGGGVSTFILRSDAAWYWQNTVVWHANNAAHHVLAPIIIEGSKYYQ